MNALSDLNIKPVYDTDDDVKGFYNDVLSRATQYDRASAYFSSGFYTYIQKGLTNLLKNNGRMRLILSTDVDKKTISEIKEGYRLKNSTEFVQKCLRNSVFNLEDINEEISIISYLIAIDKLDIKFVFKNIGLYHDKFAIIYDQNGNELLLSGSNNETEASISLNHESFQTTINWNKPSERELQLIDIRKKQFESTWNNDIQNLVVLPMTEVIKENLIDSIDYNQVSKIISNYSFIRMTVNEERKIIIQTNIDLNKIINTYQFKRLISPFVEKRTQTTITLRVLSTINDIVEIKNCVQCLANDLKIKFIQAKPLVDLIDRYFLDMNNLSNIGLSIKNLSYLNRDDEFKRFCDKTQSLVNRPLKLTQLQAGYHIVKLRRSMNFSVPGAGKTASVIGAFEYLNALDVNDPSHIDRILVFAPINAYNSWKNELGIVSKSFDKNNVEHELNIRDVNDLAEKNTLIRYGFKKAKFVFINYEIIPQIYSSLKKCIDKQTMVIFDEIHRIKNYKSKKLPLCQEIIDITNYRIALTGTPLPNGYKDLYNMFQLLYGEFSLSFFHMNVDALKKADIEFEQNGLESEEINNKIWPFFIRTNKNDLDIPKANKDHLIYVETTSLEKDAYNQILYSKRDELEKIIRLSQIAFLPNDAISLDKKISEHDINSFVEDENSNDKSKYDNVKTSKLNAFINHIKSSKEKGVVWCVFTKTIDLVADTLKENGFSVEKIYGNTDTLTRLKIIDSFLKNRNPQFLITNPHTLAESISLHNVCHKAYYLELNYNLAQYLQSRDRIHRLGLQKEQETDYYIFINKYSNNENSSIDEIIYDRLGKKERRMMNAIDSGSLLLKLENSPHEFGEMISTIKENIKK